MSNPWKKESALSLLRDLMRTAIWFCIVLIGLMGGIFAVAFCYQFFTHLWQFCARVLFSNPW